MMAEASGVGPPKEMKVSFCHSIVQSPKFDTFGTVETFVAVPVETLLCALVEDTQHVQAGFCSRGGGLV